MSAQKIDMSDSSNGHTEADTFYPYPTDEPGDAVATVEQADKRVAPTNEGAVEATRNQPHASTLGVSDVDPTPARGARTNVSHRINPDDRRFILVVTTGVVIAGLVAFAISFVALMEVAAWLGLPWWMHWAVPTFIDLAILVYAASVLVHKARGESTWKSWVMLGSFTALSVVANVAHALSYEQHAPWQSIVGAVIAGMVPFAIFAATDQLASVAVEDPETRRNEIEAQEKWLAQQARLEQERLEREHERELAREERQWHKQEHEAKLQLRRAENQARIQAIQEGKVTVLEPDGPNGDIEQAAGTGSKPGEAAVAEPTGSKASTLSRSQMPKGRQTLAPVDEVAALVASRADQGLETSKQDVLKHFDMDTKEARNLKTAQRRLSALRKERPEVFLTEGATK